MNLPSPHISLEQWRCLVAVVDAGGYAQAAALLHKSQSSVSYAVLKLERLLDLKVFAIEGRRAVLTPEGRQLYQRARQLLEDCTSLERAAGRISSGWESQIAIAVEILFPTWLLLDCFARFGEESPQTRIELYETVLEGGPELLLQGKVDLAILPRIPTGMNGEALATTLRHIPVAHPAHPLHQVGRPLTLRDLRKHRHVVVRDSASTRDTNTTSVDVAQRWTVSHMTTSIGAVCRGYGFAWLPEDKIRSELREGQLKPLQLQGGQERFNQLYLIHPDQEAIGPGVQRLTEIIRDSVSSTCTQHQAGTSSASLPSTSRKRSTLTTSDSSTLPPSAAMPSATLPRSKAATRRPKRALRG
jgi:DNA-binding transcriptional LysR family regulator